MNIQPVALEHVLDYYELYGDFNLKLMVDALNQSNPEKISSKFISLFKNKTKENLIILE